MTDLAGKTMLIAASRGDACRWYRMEVPAAALNDERVIWSDRYMVSDTTSKVHGIGWKDLLSLERIVVQRPVNQSACSLLLTIAAEKQRPELVVELDDDVWTIPSWSPARPYFYDGNRYVNLSNVIRASDRVITSTPKLADSIVANSGRTNVTVVPNSLPAGLPWVDPSEVVPKPVAVFSGGQTHAEDVRPVFKSLRAMVRSRQLDIVMMGHDYSDMLPRCTYRSWTEDIPKHYERLRSYAGALGLAPLARDTFNESKSNIRLLECAQAGILPLATSYGPYEGISGVFEVGPHVQWKYAVGAALRHDSAERWQRLTTLQSWAKNYVIDRHADEWGHAWRLNDS